jgi:uncharacterized protein YndB with AHSA1/START domain
MMLRVLLILAVCVVAVLAYASTRPDTLTIQRSRAINAPPEKVFALVDNLHNWPRWSEQDRQDQSMRRTFSGPESGVGAGSAWKGSGSSGEGTMAITESLPPSKVNVTAVWKKPFASRNMNEFVLTPEGTGTKITWTWRGQNVYPLKLMSLFTNIDRMMGTHFESSLDGLKAEAEK